MSAMFDTMILVHALAAKPLASVANDDKPQSCKRIVEKSEVIRISAIVWLEIFRLFRSESDQKRLAAIQDKLRIEPVDVEVIKSAADLQRKRVNRKTAGVCGKCGCSSTSKPCSECNRFIPTKIRFNDYIVAATAHVKSDVEVLYTYDEGVIAMKPDLRKDLDIRPPPNPYGPLFDAGEEPDDDETAKVAVGEDE